MSDVPADAMRRLLLRVPKRRRVYEAVVACPGTHARRLSRELAIALGVVEHHVRQLERHGLVFAHRQGRRRTLYAAGQVDPADARILHALRKPVCGDLLEALLQGGEGPAPLARRLALPGATVSYNLRRLRALGLVEHLRAGREGAYFLRDPGRVARLVATHRPPPVADGHGLDPTFASLLQRALLWSAVPLRPAPVVALHD